MATFLGVCGGMAIPLIARQSFQWVCAGFGGTKQVVSTLDAAIEDGPTKLTWIVGAKLLLTVVSIAAVAYVLLTASENTLLAAIQGAILAGGAGLIARWRGK